MSAIDFPYAVGVSGGTEFPEPYAIDPPVAGYAGWWDAFDIATFTFTSGRISAWADKSGNGYTNTPNENVGLAALPGSSKFVPAVNMDVTRGNFFSSSCPWAGDISASAYMVIWPNNEANYRTLLAAGASRNQWLINNTPALTTAKNGVGFLGTQGNATVVQRAPAVVAQIITSTSVKHYYDTTSETDAFGAESFTAGGTLTLGPMSGFVSECLLYLTTHNSTESGDTIDWMKTKWGI